MSKALFSLSIEEAHKKLSFSGFSDPKTAFKNLQSLSDTALASFIDEITARAALAPSPDGALNSLESIAVTVPKEALAGALREPDFLKRIVTIAGSSPFLSGLITTDPSRFEWLFLKGGLHETRDAEAFAGELLPKTSGVEDFNAVSREIRALRNREYLRIGARDLLGLASMQDTTRELSDLADSCLEAAVDFAIQRCKAAYGEPLYADFDGTVKEAVLTVLGLGKLGGRELNFSSDIDIIYVYSSDKGETTGLPERPDTKVSLHAFFVKAAMTVSKLISAVTGDGFAFRVDLNLRPEGKSGDVANSLRSMEIYYESWGQSWERAAMIKARPSAGSKGLGEEFLKMIRPFVFRRYLDFTSIEEIKTMKERIDLSRLRRNPDTIDVKLGAGGIREIEFFCQALQLIHGGRDAELRDRSTLSTLEKLKNKGLINSEEYTTLKEGYVFLRNLEHRIQIVDCRQTQMIPPSASELERLARMMGFTDKDGRLAGEYFWEEYRGRTEAIHSIYRSLFYKKESGEIPEKVLVLFSPDITEEESVFRLSALGFKEPGAAFRNLALIKTGPPFVHLSARARVLLTRLAPLFLEASSHSPDPDLSLSHLERFIASVGARTTFLSLLAENPLVLKELIKIFGSSVFLSRDLIEHPESLDILLSNELSIPYRKRGAFTALIEEELGATPADYEERLDALRRVKNQEVFRIGVNDIAAAITSRQVSVQLTFLAEACLEAALSIASVELKARYGEPTGASFFILGLGKLGGCELIYGSDLDIIFVYSGDGEGRTDGDKPISNHEFFVKLGQRIISVLTLRTREGFVFNVDARLRPSGSSGPLVVSREALIKYHRERTQVWERQAFTKARVSAGDLKEGNAVLGELKGIVFSRGLSAEDAGEIARIRSRMEVEIARENPSRYNIKTGRGGIVDIEFIVQSLQLKYGDVEALRTPYTLKALRRLGLRGILRPEELDFLKGAYRFFRLLETRLRIVSDRPEGYLDKGTGELSTLARRAGYSGPDASADLLSDYGKTAEKVRSIYAGVMEGLKN